jgi:hypothetical protein
MKTELNYEKTWSGILKKRKETYKRRSEEKEVKQEKKNTMKRSSTQARAAAADVRAFRAAEHRLTRFGILY